jgi:D-psicose/D-tagatose/L-ribulose 3-epimerase
MAANPLGTHVQVWEGDWTPEAVRRAAAGAAAAGYAFLELPVRAPETVDADAIARILAAAGLTCTASFIHTPATDIAGDDADAAAKGEALMIEALAKARDLGSTRLVGGWHSSLAKHDRPRSAAGRQRAVDILARVAGRARDMGLIMCCEALNRYENNFINTAAQALDLIGAIGADNLAVHLDTFHMNIEEADPAAAIRACGRHLGYLHVAENDRGYLGTGSIDFGAIFRALADVGYGGPIALEVFSSAVVNPEHSARLAIWRETWSDSADMAGHAHAFLASQLETAARHAGKSAS